MKLFGLNIGSKEKKSLTKFSISDFIGSKVGNLVKGNRQLNPFQSIIYYSSVSAVGKAVSILSDEFASITPKILDIKSKKFIDIKDFDVLMGTPNPDKTRSELFKAFASFYLITGKTYLMALGNVNRQALELDIVQPNSISFNNSTKDTYIDNYEYYTDKEKIIFNRQEIRRRFRYYAGDRELWHVKMFNPFMGKQNDGMSPLDMVFYELEQHLNASIHNLSTLKKGARLSGLLSVERDLQPEQQEALKEKIRGEWAGSTNAGEIAIVSGSKANFSEFSKSMKDMDFLNLKKEVTMAIYNAYNIPLPLVFSDSMTLNNYKEAKYALYDMGVLPLVGRLYEELTNFLFPRYGIDITKYKLWYDDADIPALELRRAEEIERKNKTGSLVKNEIRKLMGYDERPDGDVYTDMKQVSAIDSGAVKSVTTRDKFFEIMEKQVDTKTKKQLYSKEEIEKVADEKGLK